MIFIVSHCGMLCSSATPGNESIAKEFDQLFMFNTKFGIKWLVRGDLDKMLFQNSLAPNTCSLSERGSLEMT